MQAITTKYLSPTDTKGARIRAVCAAGSITVGYPYGLSGDAVHAYAAMALVRKLGWVPKHTETGEHQNGYVGAWACGGLPNGGYVFAFAFGTHVNPQWGLYGVDFCKAGAQ